MDDQRADLRARIEELSDEEAVSALVFFLESEQKNVSDDALEGAQEDFFASSASDASVKQELEARAQELSPLEERGELARLTLLALYEDPERRALVAHVVEHPADIGTRDFFTIAIVGAVVLALRPKIHIGKKPGEGWTVDFKTEPLKDSTMGKVIGKLLGIAAPVPPGP